jgi:plasmid stabilization system protein ParE
MDFEVIFKDTFVDDLEQLVRLIAHDNPDAANKLGQTIIDRSESLSFFPERFPTVRSRPGVRRFIVARHYKVFYRVNIQAKSVEILRFWDGRREDDPVL